MKHRMGATVFLHWKMSNCRRSAAAASGDLSSQLSYQPGMGARMVNISVNKPSNIRKHAFVLT